MPKPKEEGAPGPSYFEEQQQKYVRQVSKGRHPRSFPRVSELWYHALATGKRLDKIRAGHNVWHVLEESSTSVSAHDRLEPQEKGAEAASSFSVADSEPPSILAFPPQSAPSPSVPNFGTCIINGMQIDIRNKLQLHYGMMAVLMSERNDVLCVSPAPENEMRIKPRHAILPNDRTLFKLIDLRDLTSPHSIRYGEPVWLQIVDVSGNPGTTYGWNQATLLGTKLFGLHEMDTKHLNPSWEKDARRAAVIHNHANDSEEISGGAATGRPTGGAGGASATTRTGGSTETAAVTGGGTAASRSGGTRGSGWGRLKKDMGTAIKELIDPSQEGAADADGDSPASKKEKASAIDRTLKVRDRKGQGKERGDLAAQEQSRGQADPEAVICGAAQAVLIGAVAHAAHKQLGSADEGLSQLSAGAKVASREATVMGQIALHAADRKSAKAPGSQLGDVSLSNTSLYLAQDLYCLASSQGSKYIPWPPTSKDIAPPPDLSTPKNSPEKPQPKVQGGGEGGEGGGKGKGDDVPDDATVNSHMSHASGHTHSTAQTGITTDSKLANGGAGTASGVFGAFGKLPANMPHLVSRKLLSKKPPYEYIVDKRCVFRFCTVDNVSDTSALSVQEIAAQKLLSKAKAGLRRSEVTRKGGRVYPEETGDVVPLPSGERFSRSLRLNVSSKLLNSVSSKLLPRREKEKVLLDHFRAYCGPGWDRGDEEDDVSIAGSSIGHEPISAVYERGHGHEAYNAGLDALDGGFSMGSISVGDESHYPHSHGHGGAGVDGLGGGGASVNGSSIASVVQRPRIVLPPDHREAHEQQQSFLLEQSMRAKVTRPYHYSDYPNYYKNIPPSSANPKPGPVPMRQFNLLDPRLSIGETVVSLRQSLENTGAKVLHGMFLDAKLAEFHQEKEASSPGSTKASPAQRKKEVAVCEPKPDFLRKLHEQDMLVGASIDHVDRLKAIEAVTKNMERFKA